MVKYITVTETRDWVGSLDWWKYHQAEYTIAKNKAECREDNKRNGIQEINAKDFECLLE